MRKQALFLFFCFYSSSGVAAPISSSEIFQKFFKDSLESSPEMRSAELNASQKKAQRYTFFARWLPRLDGQLSQIKTVDYSFIQGGAIGSSSTLFEPKEVNLSRYSLNLSFPIYRRSVHVNAMIGLSDASLANTQVELKKGELHWRVLELLGKYFTSRYRLAALDHSLQLSETNLKEAKLRFELGQKTKVDVLKAEANKATIDTKKFSTEQQLATDQTALIDYTGAAIDSEKIKLAQESFKTETELLRAIEEITVTDELEKNLSAWMTDYKVLEERISEASPHLRSSNEEFNLSENRASASMAQEWPELLIQGQYSKQGPDWETVAKPDQTSKQISLVLNIPLFTGFTTVSTYYEKLRAQQSAAVKREREVMKLKADVENLVRQLKANKKNVDANHLLLNQNEEIVRLSLKSYQLGKASLTEVLMSQNDLLDSKMSYADSRVQYAVQLSRLAWYLGVSPL